MKFKRLIIIGIAVVAVAAIALLLGGRNQTDPEPIASKQEQTLPETEEIPLKISKLTNL